MYASLQNCTKDIEQFQYHCAINEYKNATVEVCAPVRFIIDGFCTEFNTKGARIQPHYGVKCSDFPNPCPDRYKSTESYKYPMCYEYAIQSSKITTMEGIYTTPHMTNSSTSNSGQSNETSS
ncbi:uncharacterized protein LOC133204302 [Saccostrea echinata]|uniref:uncharacterized protein LOC133204302 n=1 Tax=Saccostrea echinata TaxID=191078 RepID=UPI002A7F4E9D|nr:uncharacterized protein LOC133204302 [Saccostrea echinata]